jgi:hypothetical protein
MTAEAMRLSFQPPEHPGVNPVAACLNLHVARLRAYAVKAVIGVTAVLPTMSPKQPNWARAALSPQRRGDSPDHNLPDLDHFLAISSK